MGKTNNLWRGYPMHHINFGPKSSKTIFGLNRTLGVKMVFLRYLSHFFF
jgi:hypothetical protein